MLASKVCDLYLYRVGGGVPNAKYGIGGAAAIPISLWGAALSLGKSRLYFTGVRVDLRLGTMTYTTFSHWTSSSGRLCSGATCKRGHPIDCLVYGPTLFGSPDAL